MMNLKEKRLDKRKNSFDAVLIYLRISKQIDENGKLTILKVIT